MKSILHALCYLSLVPIPHGPGEDRAMPMGPAAGGHTVWLGPGRSRGGMLGEPPGEKNHPQPYLFTSENHFRRLCISVPTLGLFWEVAVHDAQLRSCNTTKSTFWHQLLMWPKPRAGFPRGEEKVWAASWAYLLARWREGLPLPQHCCVTPPSQQGLLRGDAAALRWVPGAPDRIFLDQRKPESCDSSDWRHLQLCNMQFQCLKWWEFNRAPENFNICLKSIWQVLKQQHNSLNVSLSSDKIHL